MKKAAKLLLPGLLMVMAAGEANAYWIDVNWGAYHSITLNLIGYNGNNNFTVNIGPANGRESATQAGLASAATNQFFCVDVTKGTSSGTDYQVDRHTQADGTLGWTTPTNDLDNLRSLPGLGRAAMLANRFGYSGSTDANSIAQGSGVLNTAGSDRNKRTIALNVAIWNAAYGSVLSYVSGLDAAETGYYNTYMAAYNTGASDNAYTWYDHAVNDGLSNAQDFITGVPEPSSLMLLGSALATGSALLARRKKRSA